MYYGINERGGKNRFTLSLESYQRLRLNDGTNLTLVM